MAFNTHGNLALHAALLFQGGKIISQLQLLKGLAVF
jgi:hypothetical protein